MADRYTPFTQQQVDAVVADQLRRVQAEGGQPEADVQPMNWLEQRMRPDADAVTVGKYVRYNPAMLAGRTPDDISDMLVHELAHVKQHPGFAESLFSLLRSQGAYPIARTDPATWNSEELEAFQAETDRRRAQHRPEPLGVGPTGDQIDIQLPARRR